MVKKMGVLEDIQKSLDEKPEKPVATPPFKKDSTVDLAQALLKLPKLLAALDVLVAEQKRENDWRSSFTDFQCEIEKLSVKVDCNLKQTGDIQKRLQRRLDSFDVLEAQWQRLVNRVSAVLDDLERVLKRM